MATLALHSSTTPTIASRSMSSGSAATTASSSESSTCSSMSGASSSDTSDTSVEADSDQHQQQDTFKAESRPPLFLSSQQASGNSAALEVMSASPTTTTTTASDAEADDAGEESEEHSSRSSRDTIKRKSKTAGRTSVAVLDKDTFATPTPPFVAPTIAARGAGKQQGLGKEHAELRESGQQRQKHNVVDHQHSTIQRYLSQLPVTNTSQYSYHYVQGQASRRGKPSSRPSSPNTFATPQSPSSGAVISPTPTSSTAPYSSSAAVPSSAATPVAPSTSTRTRRPSLAASTSTTAAGGGGPPASAAAFRRHALARSYTLNSVSTMLHSPSSPVLLSSNTSGSPPHTLLSTTVGSVAPPVHNSASVTFAPEPTTTATTAPNIGNPSSNAAAFAAAAAHGRPRSHSHSQSLAQFKVTSPIMSPLGAFDAGANRPLSPAVASMALAAATSLACPSSPSSSSSSSPPAHSSKRKNSLLASASSSMSVNNTTSTTTSNSVGAMHHSGPGSRASSSTTAITDAAPPPLLHSNTHPYHHSPPDHGRRHSVDPSAYSYLSSDTSGTNINHTHNTIIAPGLTSPAPSSSSATLSATPPLAHSGTVAGHAIRSSQQQQQHHHHHHHHHHPRRHHQSVSGAPVAHSQSQYSSLADSHNAGSSHTTTTDQLLQLSSRYRKAALGSQTLLSPSGSGLMHFSSSSSSSTATNTGPSNSSSAVTGASPESVMPASSWQSQWDVQHHRYSPNKDLGGSGSGSNGSNVMPGQAGSQHHQSQQQHSPTRSRGDPYLSTSPRYSGRASHDSQRNNQLEAKIVLLGRQGVGKTSLVHRYITGQFSSSLPMTIGASFLVKKLDFEGGIKVRLQIWDTAGQERFRSMAPMYYRGAHAAILVYDITNDDSLADIRVWLDELRRNMSSDLIVHIVGNKADLAHSSRKITLEHARSQIAQWIAQPASAMESGPSQTSSTLSVPPGRRSTSGGNGQPTSASARSGTEDTNMTSSRPSMATLASFSLSRSNSRQKPIEEQEALPAFKDWGIEEVSAKEDEGIDILFATIAGKLVERKHQIEQERTLRTKDSIMITDEMKGINAQDPTRVWGCC